MRFTKRLLLIMLFALVALLVMSAGFAINNTAVEQHDFDSYFTMNVPKGVSFEKNEGTPTTNVNLSVNYRNYTQKINILYVESVGAKDNLLTYYTDMAKNDENVTLKSYNNTTVLHFKGDNIIGEENYHDMAISGNNEKYILMQCDNESLMKTMAESIKFN